MPVDAAALWRIETSDKLMVSVPVLGLRERAL